MQRKKEQSAFVFKRIHCHHYLRKSFTLWLLCRCTVHAHTRVILFVLQTNLKKMDWLAGPLQRIPE